MDDKAAYYERNREQIRAKQKLYYKANRESFIKRSREWRLANPEANQKLKNGWRRTEKGKKQSREWVAANKDKHARAVTNWRKNNPDARAEHTRTRQARKLQAAPPWLTKEHRRQIRSFYTEAKQIEAETGIPQHVDHIIPLQNPDVCGLHVPWNLQVLDESANAAKHNRFDRKDNETRLFKIVEAAICSN